MLRQVLIFHGQKLIFSHSLALAFNNDEIANITEVIKNNLENPIPGKTFNRTIGEYQLFHRSAGNSYFIAVTDMIDSRAYMDNLIKKMIKDFNKLCPNPETIKDSSKEKEAFVHNLILTQKELHSKIVLIGPPNSGKTMLYNLVRSGSEKQIMNFAVSSSVVIENMNFDIWNFVLKDNFSLFWSKYVSGADLIILMFDASNYKLEVLEHFLKFRKLEGKYSRFLVVANKRDLIGATDIERIKSEIKEDDLKELSLIIPNSKNLIIDIMKDGMKLKPKTMHKSPDILLKEARKLESGGKIIAAISKYKDLIQICTKNQDLTRIGEYQQKLIDLKTLLEGQVTGPSDAGRKSPFVPVEQKKFSQKVQVKKSSPSEVGSNTRFAIPKQKKFSQKVQVKTSSPSDIGNKTRFAIPEQKKFSQKVQIASSQFKPTKKPLQAKSTLNQKQSRSSKLQPLQPQLPSQLKAITPQQSKKSLNKLTLSSNDLKIDLSVVRRENQLGRKYDDSGKRIRNLEISKQLIETQLIETKKQAQQQRAALKPIVKKHPVQKQPVPKPIEKKKPLQQRPVLKPIEKKKPLQQRPVLKPIEKKKPLQQKPVLKPVIQLQPLQQRPVPKPLIKKQPIKQKPVLKPTIQKQTDTKKPIIKNIINDIKRATTQDTSKKVLPIEKEETKPFTSEDLKTESDYPLGLQKLIIQKGSNLKLKLCEQFITEIKTVLNRELYFEDLVIATDLFIEQENC